MQMTAHFSKIFLEYYRLIYTKDGAYMITHRLSFIISEAPLTGHGQPHYLIGIQSHRTMIDSVG